MTTSSRTSGEKRRHATGHATRVTLMETAESLFAQRGLDGVTLREIQLQAGQANSSVIPYHFGSKDGLIRSLIEYRHVDLDRDRQALLEKMGADGPLDARSVVWLIVRPFVNSLRAGQYFVPFLARLSEHRHARSLYWPEGLDQPYNTDAIERMVHELLRDKPERIRRGRSFQLQNSVLNLLGEQALNDGDISDAQLHNYVDGWVALLTAPVSDETSALL